MKYLNIISTVFLDLRQTQIQSSYYNMAIKNSGLKISSHLINHRIRKKDPETWKDNINIWWFRSTTNNRSNVAMPGSVNKISASIFNNNSLSCYNSYHLS